MIKPKNKTFAAFTVFSLFFSSSFWPYISVLEKNLKSWIALDSYATACMIAPQQLWCDQTFLCRWRRLVGESNFKTNHTVWGEKQCVMALTLYTVKLTKTCRVIFHSCTVTLNFILLCLIWGPILLLINPLGVILVVGHLLTAAILFFQ